ncbi:MAG: protein-L-isoaspartate O-methyltransferase [Geminicoccaceae bacterium]|nr:protein-L-isoaspartate O-methyltransferase [Geminicoccaceae bacterium]MCS7268084.1 protein-L-isoaspartate O-methyltransferase [Geminicoccaceae bacterium]MCX7630834.1 protein-L-isoaspartate O-methyltransferase [Geminicoccaceae bacterium]MDW8125984.1 protein-L-isoaspartate O-methyltransferase [Geminicoccaceae bacterium]MDW8342330.1 protein-L-isoaspartate O-methyltransferase [Geminicoccaceae bacterium]
MIGLVLAQLFLAGPWLAPPEISPPAFERVAEADFARAREEMIRHLALEAAATAHLTGVRELDPRVLEAMREVPRERFVPAALRAHAYGPGPLPIHPAQNLTAPFLTALMLHAAEIRPGARVFETGTDTGYQAALLARMGAEVTTVEILPELAEIARRLLSELAPGRVALRVGDGYDGWPERAPFDAIIVKEAVDHLPPPLLAQLAPDGRLVLPLGPADGVQYLTVVRKTRDGRLETRRLLPVRFAPFQRGSPT